MVRFTIEIKNANILDSIAPHSGINIQSEEHAQQFIRVWVQNFNIFNNDTEFKYLENWFNRVTLHAIDPDHIHDETGDQRHYMHRYYNLIYNNLNKTHETWLLDQTYKQITSWMINE